MYKGPGGSRARRSSRSCSRWIVCCSLVVVALGTLESHAQIVDGKRGWAGGDASMADAANSYWYYNWWHTKPAGADSANADWIPLVKYTNNLQNKLDIVTGYNDVDTILVLNEPERENQSNVTVAEAISIWPQFEATGLNLITPAVSDNVEGRAWLDDFMSQASANDYRMDGVAFHWYGADNPNNPTGAANSFLSRVDYYWNTYNLPVWITEFAMHDWGGNYTDQQMLDANEQFLEVAIPGLESRSYVEAYSWYRGFSDSRVFEDQQGLLTPNGVGDEYIPSYRVGDTFNINGSTFGNDTLYLRGGQITNAGAAIDNALKKIYAIEGTSDLSGPADWGTTGSGWVEINANATLQKTGNSTIKLNGSQINNRGVLRVAAGALQLQGGTQASGAGVVEVQAGATLSLGKASDRGGVSLAQELELRGGTVKTNTIADGTHTLSSVVTVHNTSRFSGDGLLIVAAPISAPPGGGGGGIIKEGTGTLLLSSNNTYEGDTVVNQGKLKLADTAALLNSPLIRVDASATLDVTDFAAGYTLDGQGLKLAGQIDGSLNATNGSTLTARGGSAVITGNLTADNSTIRIGDVVSIPAIVSTGLRLNFDAAQDAAGDATWTNAAAPGTDVAFSANASPVAVADAAFPGITAAYDISSTGSAGGLNDYFEQQSPARSREDATFEVVFHVSSTTAGDNQVLFEVGADRGVSFLLSGNSLSFNVDGDGSALAVSTDLTPGWHQAVGVIDLVGTDDNLANDSFELFVDNVSAGSQTGVLIDDWAGGNITGVGGPASGVAGTPTPVNYHGDVAVARFYNDFVFGAAEVTQNYQALVGIAAGLPTTLSISGDYAQLSGAILEIDLLDVANHDELAILGSATLGGTLDVGALAGFAPTVGDSYTILTAAGGVAGEFDSFNLPQLTDLGWSVQYDSHSVVLDVVWAADFDADGDVDGGDFLVWQRGLNAAGGLADGDADGNGFVDAADLAIWQSQYGNIAGSPAASSTAVPEPTVIGLIAAGFAALLPLRRQSL